MYEDTKQFNQGFPSQDVIDYLNEMEADLQDPEVQKAFSVPPEDPQPEIQREIERTAKGDRGRAWNTETGKMVITQEYQDEFLAELALDRNVAALRIDAMRPAKT